MNIIHTIDNVDLYSGGPSLVVGNLSSGLARAGHNVTVVTSYRSDDFTDVVDTGAANVLPAAEDNIRCGDNLAPLFATCPPPHLGNLRPDLIHDHGIWLPINDIAAKLANDRTVPLVISPHGTLQPWARNTKKLKKLFAWLTYQKRNLVNATAFHATSAEEAYCIRKAGLMQPIAVIAPGVDLPAASHPGPHPPNNTRPPEGNEIRKAVFLGRIHPVKGLDLLVDAWAAVRPQNWQLMLAGPDSSRYANQLRRRVAELGITDSVLFSGPTDGRRRASLFADAEVLILPSRSENFGLVVAEALASGVPVITTTRTPWQALSAEQCGWQVAPTSAAIANILRSVTHMPASQLRSMGERGRRYACTHFRWPDQVEKMHSFYQWLTGTARMPSTVQQY